MDSKTASNLRQEQAAQLRHLKRSPGWALLSTRLALLLAEREREKAVHLRKGDVQRSIVLQGELDGLQESLSFIDKLIDELSLEQNQTEPAY